MDPRIASLLSLLKSHREDLDRAVVTVPPAVRDTPPEANGWSVAGVLEHLVGTERADGRMLEATQRPHPITGTVLDGYQWVAFVALHEGRHARQIEEIGSSLGAGDVGHG